MVDRRIDQLPALVGTPAVNDVVAGWDLSGLVTVKISGQQLIDLQPTATPSVRGFMSAADKTKLDSLSGGIDGFRTQPIWACDFFNANTNQFDPFAHTAIASGSINAPTSAFVTRHHPGVVRFRSSATANSGYEIGTSVNTMILLGGNEVFEAILNIATLADTLRLGFLDTATSADAADGAYFEVPATGAVVAKTSNNSVRTTSATLFTASVSTWYRFRVTVNSDATSVNFEVFNDSGTSQGSTNITTNIPTTNGRETGINVIATNSGTIATDLIHLDYMAFGYAGVLTR